MNCSGTGGANRWGRRRGAVIAAGTVVLHAAVVTGTCPFTCGDLNGDQVIDLTDFGVFEGCFGESPGSSQECFCSDLDGSDTIDLRDFALFTLIYGQTSDEVPPGCTGAIGTGAAEMTAYRPQHGGGYAPFVRTAVADADEESPTVGPGIRLNHPGDVDPSGEDDLIEVVVNIAMAGAQVAVRRSDAALAVWTTRDRQAGTEIAFVNDQTGALPFGPSDTDLTVWVEWATATHGIADLRLEPLASNVAKDTLVFHTFESIVAALGGEGQVPSDPADPEAGTFVVATHLYGLGYDVHMFDEDSVGADGSGAVFEEVADAIQNRGVGEVAIFGYSHGGGSTYDLADLLDINRPTLGVFDIRFTSYVDSVSNNSDIDVGQELRRPPATDYHLNHYQHGTFGDFWLDGGPVPNSNPPPTGLDVETTAWGANATHFEVDDFGQVLDLMETSLIPRVTR
ncbi:MAG: hypothetical protein GY778_11085 [bacterium]|nr:hypothetical protein [bacterium]